MHDVLVFAPGGPRPSSLSLDSSGRGLVIEPPSRGRREGDQLDRSNELDRSNASCKLM